MSDQGWAALFAAAFKRSRNGMALVDEDRTIIDANPAFLRMLGQKRRELVGRPLWTNVAGGPILNPQQWSAQIAHRSFHGEAGLMTADGDIVSVQWGATTETVTGHRLILFVALSTSRWGIRFRRNPEEGGPARELSVREREIVHLVALGQSGPEIAEELGIAHDTVRTHVRNAMTKLNARSRAHLVAKALGHGHVPGDRDLAA